MPLYMPRAALWEKGKPHSNTVNIVDFIALKSWKMC